MIRPEFTAEERYLIDSFRRPRSRRLATQDALLTLPALMLVSFGIADDNTTVLVFSVSLMVLHRIFDIAQTVKWGRVVHTILLKYEQALDDHSGSPMEATGTV